MIWFKYYKQIHHLQKYFSCRSTLGRYIHCIYRIEPNLNFSVSSPQEILQILQVLPSSSSSLLSSFNDSAKSLHCHNGPGCSSTWGKSSLKTVSDGIFSSYTVSDGIFFSYLMVSSLPLPRNLKFKWLQLDSNPQPLSSKTTFNGCELWLRVQLLSVRTIGSITGLLIMVWHEHFLMH